jgi:hypothetical protein
MNNLDDLSRSRTGLQNRLDEKPVEDPRPHWSAS